mmetsp:Transcript_17623/g.30372  ORF Transcript_17623/g.30372 Transcript_17623/m.30372 type:complete len:301 (+) Transcript_17623:273-1175(+)
MLRGAIIMDLLARSSSIALDICLIIRDTSRPIVTVEEEGHHGTLGYHVKRINLGEFATRLILTQSLHNEFKLLIVGNYESFAYDDQDLIATRYFVTEDSADGVLTRYTPGANAFLSGEKYDILSSDGGTHEFLILDPTTGTFSWTMNVEEGRENANDYFPNAEGIDCHNRMLNFVSKKRKRLFTLDLKDGTYTDVTTESGLFNLEPDQIGRVVGDAEILYFAEDGGTNCDIHGRDSTGQYFTIVEDDNFYNSETSGLAFSPDGKFFYVAFQDDSNIVVFWRTDGLPFNGVVADTRYHTVR